MERMEVNYNAKAIADVATTLGITPDEFGTYLEVRAQNFNAGNINGGTSYNDQVIETCCGIDGLRIYSRVEEMLRERKELTNVVEGLFIRKSPSEYVH